MQCQISRCSESTTTVKPARFRYLNFLPHTSPSFLSTSSSMLRSHSSHASTSRRIHVSKTVPRTIVTARVRRLHPTLLPSLLPILPTVKQFRRDFGPPSTALDRILISVLVLGLLHLFPTSRILTIAKLLAFLWPLLHPLLSASRKNAQLRFSANQSPPLIVAGKLQVRTTRRGTVVRVSDGSDLSTYSKPLLTAPDAIHYDGNHACALVVGGRIIDVVVRNIHLAPYPCIRRRVLNEVCTAIYADG